LFISTHSIEESQRLAGTAQGSEGSISVNKFCHPHSAPKKLQERLIFKSAWQQTSWSLGFPRDGRLMTNLDAAIGSKRVFRNTVKKYSEFKVACQ
jgi:hypothetical protein